MPSLPAEGIDWECPASPDALNPAHRVGDVCHAQEATGAVRGRRPRPSFSHARSALRRFAGLRVDGDEVVALRPHPPGDVDDRGPILGSQPSRPQRSRAEVASRTMPAWGFRCPERCAFGKRSPRSSGDAVLVRRPRPPFAPIVHRRVASGTTPADLHRIPDATCYASRRFSDHAAAASSAAVQRQNTVNPCHGDSRSPEAR